MAQTTSEQFETHHMRCMEVWGGTAAADEAVSAPGLDVFVRAEPYHGDAAGGDIHYLSMCGSGSITRFLVADVAGHGEQVAGLAASLRALVRRHINRVDGTKLARSLNDEFAALSSSGRFATAISCTYFAPTDQMVVVNAGHPRPLWYRAATGTWQLLDTECEAVDDAGPKNLPLGVIGGTGYEQFAVTLERGDVVLLYTDALMEAADPTGRQLGEQGLLALARTTGADRPSCVSRQLLQAVATYRGGAPADDDVTLVAIHHNASDPPTPSLGELVTTVAKMMGLKRV